MFSELDTVVLTSDFDEHSLRQGDVGVVVHRYQGGQAYEVEFVSADGNTIALLTLPHSKIRLMDSQEILRTLQRP